MVGQLDLFGAGVGFLKWMADYEGVCGGSASNENWCKVFLLLTRQMEARKDYVAKNILPYTQLGRLIAPEEIADAICFMLANAAVSGQLWVDAGWHAPA